MLLIDFTCTVFLRSKAQPLQRAGISQTRPSLGGIKGCGQHIYLVLTFSTSWELTFMPSMSTTDHIIHTSTKHPHKHTLRNV